MATVALTNSATGDNMRRRASGVVSLTAAPSVTLPAPSGLKPVRAIGMSVPEQVLVDGRPA